MFTYYGVKVQLLGKRSVSGGISADVTVVDENNPWTMTYFTCNFDLLVEV